MNTRMILAGVFGLCGVTMAVAKPLEAPTRLKVKPLGVNSFQLDWKDNSTNETGWEIRVALGGANPQFFQRVETPDLNGYAVVTNDVAGQLLSFQVLAYRKVNGREQVSPGSRVVMANALPRATFGVPRALTARALDDGRLRIGWKDRSTSEGGYQLEMKTKKGKWEWLGNTGPGRRFSIVSTGYQPATHYAFRTRAFKGYPPVFTAYSNVAKVRMPAFRRPVKLVAAAVGEGRMRLQWSDRSSVEEGYQIQFKTDGGVFQTLGEVPANTRKTAPIDGFGLNTLYQFRVRGVREVGGVKRYSAFSNVSAARTRRMFGPGALAGVAVDGTSVELSWTDRSGRELGYQVRYRVSGTTEYLALGNAAENATGFTATGLEPGKVYDFQVRAFDFTQYSAFAVVRDVATPVVP